MKKSTLIALITAAALIVAGIVIGLVAMFMGADPVELYNNGSISVTREDIRRGFTVGREGEFSSRPAQSDINVTASDGGEYELTSTVESIIINWVSGSVTVAPGNTDTVRFSESASGKAVSDEHALRFSLKDGRLEIDYCADDAFFGFNFGTNPSKDLVVTIPAGLDSLYVDCTSADVHINDTEVADKLRVSTVSGDAVLSGVSCGSAELDSTSGTMSFAGKCGKLDGSNVSGELVFAGSCMEFDAESTSGGVEADFAALPEEISVDTVSGSVELSLPTGDFELEFDSVSGSMYCDFPVKMDGSVYRAGNGRTEIGVGTVSGGLCIYEK